MVELFVSEDIIKKAFERNQGILEHKKEIYDKYGEDYIGSEGNLDIIRYRAKFR